MLIYMATNNINGKQYVGQTTNDLKKRKADHVYTALNKRDKIYFHKAIRKYGPDNFDWEIIYDCITNIDFLNRLEIFYIGYYNTFGNGYNLTLGGRNALVSEEAKQKMSEAAKGKKLSIETKKRMSEARIGKKNPMYGKTHNIEAKKKVSEANKGNKYRLGIKHKEETKRRMSENMKGKYSRENSPMYGKKHSAESKEKMSKSSIGKNVGKDNVRARPVIINDRYFVTLTEAAKFIGKTPSNTRYRILHKTRWLGYKYK